MVHGRPAGLKAADEFILRRQRILETPQNPERRSLAGQGGLDRKQQSWFFAARKTADDLLIGSQGVLPSRHPGEQQSIADERGSDQQEKLRRLADLKFTNDVVPGGQRFSPAVQRREGIRLPQKCPRNHLEIEFPRRFPMPSDHLVIGGERVFPAVQHLESLAFPDQGLRDLVAIVHRIAVPEAPQDLVISGDGFVPPGPNSPVRSLYSSVLRRPAYELRVCRCPGTCELNRCRQRARLPAGPASQRPPPSR